MMETILRVMRNGFSAAFSDTVKLLRAVLEMTPLTYTVVALDEWYVFVGLDTLYVLLMMLLLFPVHILM